MNEQSSTTSTVVVVVVILLAGILVGLLLAYIKRKAK